MTTNEPNDCAPSDLAPPEAAPPSEGGDAVDWPDRSHWSEFDLAIEAGLTAEPEAEPDQPEGATQPRT